MMFFMEMNELKGLTHEEVRKKKYSVAKPTNLKRIPVPVPGKSSSAMSSPCLML